MIISTSTTVYSDLTTVTSSLISSIMPYLILIIGVVLAFYITQILISTLVRPEKKESKTVYDEHGNVKYIEF